MYKRLSYSLDEGDPVWPGAPTLKIKENESLKNGDICNTYKIELPNHYGSHMDGARHFDDNGLRLEELPLDNFIYKSPLLIDIPKSYGEKVIPDELNKYREDILKADLLMIRSGFSRYRESDSERYAKEGPYVAAETAKLLVTEYQNLKALAVDWISLASPLNMEDCILAHQYMLGTLGNGVINIIEDICLEGLENGKIERVFALPLFVRNVDSCPVTVLAEIGSA